MLRVMTAPVRSHKAMVAFSASALMVVLVAHLVVMATPLHDLAMQRDWSTGTASTDTHHDDADLPAGVQVADLHTGTDCAIIWTVVARQSVGFPVTVAAVPTMSSMIGIAPHSSPPLPRTLSPPLGADWQALLRVFRL